MESDPSVVELTAALACVQELMRNALTAADAVRRLAEVARDLIPLATGAGVTLIDEHGEATSTAVTDPEVEVLDAIQYELGEGPCLTAWDTVTVQHVEDTTTETRWPDWSRAVAAVGVRSVLSVPLVHRGQEIGAVKVYATEPYAFTEHEEHLLGLLAEAAGTLLGNARTARAAHGLSDSLQAAVIDLQEIETAVGILMERHQVDAGAARSRLLVAARQQQLPLLDIAARLVHHADDPRL
ncbi:MAG TPA: GAF and ANTAR domain-containing protein [Kocuria rosea]|nr:GAF and ANTAR domain-containing protein [Kocuria rosea]